MFALAMDEVLVRRLHPEAAVPSRAHSGDAGLDLCSTIDVRLEPGERAAIPTGIAIAIPPGFAGFVQPRSGSALHKGLGIVNSPGLIDSGYRGEIRVIAVNLDARAAIDIARGDKIAQLVVVPVPSLAVREVGELPPSGRGERGFGSTGA